MAEKKVIWKPTCDRFVAFLDIMGFKDIVYRESHEKIRAMLESLRPTIEEIEVFAKSWLMGRNIDSIDLNYPFITPSITFPVSFSDSIILFSSDESINAAGDIIAQIVGIFSEAIKNGIPMKGALAYGPQTADLEKSIYFGKPLIDAYELQNELILYGVVLHHTAEKHIRDLKWNSVLGSDLIEKYPVPMKSGKINHFIINWALFSEIKINANNLVSKLYNTVSGTPRLYIDNTIEFLNWLEEKAKQRQKKKPV